MTPPPSYVFLGSPPLAAVILRQLVERVAPPRLVVTQEAKAAGRGQALTPTAVELAAQELGLPVLRTANVNSEESLQRIRSESPELLIVAAFGQIFREPLLAIPKRYCLNVHTSLLPKYRGAAPVQWSIWNGDPLTGVSIQKMVKKLDAGDILIQRQIPIEANDTSETVLEKLAPLGADALAQCFSWIAEGTELFLPQDESLVSLAPKIEKSHAFIDWNRPAPAIRNQIRALQPWPVAEAKLGQETLKIYRASVVPGFRKRVGTIQTDAKTKLWVQAGQETALALEEVQLQSRKRLPIAQFLAGYRGEFPFPCVALPSQLTS